MSHPFPVSLRIRFKNRLNFIFVFAGALLIWSSSACSPQIMGEVFDPSISDEVGENEQRLFITSSTFSPDSGRSRADMDSLCTSRATDAGLSRTYLAIASVAGSAAKTRWSRSVPIYQVSASGAKKLVASTTEELWSENALVSNPEFDEWGATVAATNIWTGTSSSGEVSPGGTCADWGGGGSGISGRSQGDPLDTAWLNRNLSPCSSAFRIYCLSQ